MVTSDRSVSETPAALRDSVLLSAVAGMGVLTLVVTLVDNNWEGPDGLVLPLLLLSTITLLVHSEVFRLQLAILLPAVVGGPTLLFFLGWAEGSMFYLSLAALLTIHDLGSRRLANSICGSLVMVPVVAGLTSHPEAGWGFWFLGVILGWLFGLIVRLNKDLVTELEASRAHSAEQAVLEERRRMARDVHDLVGHSLTVVLLHVTGARRALRRNPAAAEEALESAERVGRESLAEIRRSVSLLRTDEGIETHPSPTAADVEQLVAERRVAGQALRLRVVGDPERVGASIGLTAYRLVQESLSNAAKHSPGSSVEIELIITEDECRISVENELLAAPDKRPAGYGLIGMRERVQGVGGNLVVGPAGNQWRVDAVLPLERAPVE